MRTLKLPSPTKPARLGNFPPASQEGRLAGPVFYPTICSLILFLIMREALICTYKCTNVQRCVNVRSDITLFYLLCQTRTFTVLHKFNTSFTLRLLCYRALDVQYCTLLAWKSAKWPCAPHDPPPPPGPLSPWHADLSVMRRGGSWQTDSDAAAVAFPHQGPSQKQCLSTCRLKTVELWNIKYLIKCGGSAWLSVL